MTLRRVAPWACELAHEHCNCIATWFRRPGDAVLVPAQGLTWVRVASAAAEEEREEHPSPAPCGNFVALPRSVVEAQLKSRRRLCRASRPRQGPSSGGICRTELSLDGSPPKFKAASFGGRLAVF